MLLHTFASKIMQRYTDLLASRHCISSKRLLARREILAQAILDVKENLLSDSHFTFELDVACLGEQIINKRKAVNVSMPKKLVGDV